MAVRGGDQAVGGDAAQSPGLEVLEGLHELGPRVHDERPVHLHVLPDRAPTEDEHLQRLGTAVLLVGGRDRHGVTRAEDRGLPRADRTPLGADGPGKAEATVAAVAACSLFCDEWAQASHGGELTGAIDAGLVTRDRVTELGAVLAGEARGRAGLEAVTLFDSTGLAIQDLAVARAAYQAWKSGAVSAQTIML